MQKNASFEKRIYELKRLIPILEWDIPNIMNNQLKAIKEEQLVRCKRELKELLEKNRTKLEVT